MDHLLSYRLKSGDTIVQPVVMPACAAIHPIVVVLVDASAFNLQPAELYLYLLCWYLFVSRSAARCLLSSLK